MRHWVGIIAASALITVIGTGCGPRTDESRSNSSSNPSTSASAKASSEATTPTPTFASNGRMVLLDKLSIPRMEGWEYFSPEEGEADRDSLTDAFYDAEGCSAKALKVNQCPKAIVNDDAATSKIAEEENLPNPFKGMHRDLVAAYVLCSIDPSKKGVKPLKPATDDIDGVTAYRYHVNLRKDCGFDPKSIPLLDPSFNGGTTWWMIKTNKVNISILTYDSGAKGMVKYANIDKFRYALTHGKWVK